MELPAHLKEIRQQLLSDEISWSEALDSLKAAKKKKPWHNKISMKSSLFVKLN